MDKDVLAADVLRKLINTKTKYKNPVRDCLEAYLLQRHISLTDAEKEEVCGLVADKLRRLARR